MEATYNEAAMMAVALAAREWMESTLGGVALFMDMEKVEIWGMPDLDDRCPGCGQIRKFKVVVSDLRPDEELVDVADLAGQILGWMRQARLDMDGCGSPSCN
jgi:hypothetical protein